EELHAAAGYYQILDIFLGISNDGHCYPLDRYFFGGSVCSGGSVGCRSSSVFASGSTAILGSITGGVTTESG
ncbi:MAG TPA: hypothetical protein VFU48_00920, partial [Nitrospira sp.]|nr:hypothetical protein [Nitrospira sp.]